MTVKGMKRRIAFFLVNKLFCGTRPHFWDIKRNLLNWAGIKIGRNTKIVGPIKVSGNLVIGEKVVSIVLCKLSCKGVLAGALLAITRL